MNRILFSTDHNPTYAWFAPLSSLMWQRVVGFKPVVAAVGPVDPWLLEQTAATGADVVRICNVKGVSSASMSQFCRLFPYLMGPVNEYDYLMLVDIDAWPMQRDIFQPTGADLDLIFPNWCMPFFPMGYNGALLSTWRAMVGVEATCVEEAVIKVMQTHPELIKRTNSKHHDPLWNFDEAYITERIRAWPGFPDRCRQYARVGGDLLNDRIDRIRWPSEPRPDGMVDAHLLRPGWTDENWPRIRPLLAALLPAADLAWADQYRAAYLARLA